MLRTLLVLFLLALCGFYFYQKQQVERPLPAVTPHIVDDSYLLELKKVLPSVIFEKDIQPAIERNRSQGLTPEQVDALLDKLDTIGRALGGKASEAVQQAARTIAPELPPRKDLAERTADVAGSLARSVAKGVKALMPALRELAADALQGMVAALSRMLDMAADLMQSR